MSDPQQILDEAFAEEAVQYVLGDNLPEGFTLVSDQEIRGDEWVNYRRAVVEYIGGEPIATHSAFIIDYEVDAAWGTDFASEEATITPVEQAFLKKLVGYRFTYTGTDGRELAVDHIKEQA